MLVDLVAAAARSCRLHRRLHATVIEIFIEVGVLPITETFFAYLDEADLAALPPAPQRVGVGAQVLRGLGLGEDWIGDGAGKMILAGFTAGDARMISIGLTHDEPMRALSPRAYRSWVYR